MKKIVLQLCISGLLFVSGRTLAQQPFAIGLQASTISVPATHSGAFAERNGKWIFIGGRIDGVHIMQAMMAFPVYGKNDSIYVVDPATNTRYSADATTLPNAIYEAITSSNMQFIQNQDHLYMIGGYGRIGQQNQWVTFPSLVSVDLDCLVAAVTSGSSISSCFRQITDQNMAVAGGGLELIDSTYYLVFGHRFDGQYARVAMGGMFTQTYTHEIRKFNIQDDGTNLAIANYTALTDTDVYHRRDYNLVPQLFPNGEYGLTAFSGVFQKTVDLPFLTPIDITPSTVTLQSNFNQNLSQYTCATLPVYDSLNNFMHTIFFGGMSLYTMDTITQTLLQDTLVPFVTTISKVSRDGSGNLSEYKLPVNMPELLGSNAFFIPEQGIPMKNNRLVDLNRLSGVTRVGYIVGGIKSDYPNVANLDPEGMSRPNANVYEVYIDRTVTGTRDIKVDNAVNNLSVYPMPAKDKLYIDFSLGTPQSCEVTMYNLQGQLVRSLLREERVEGPQHLVLPLNSIRPGTYLCRVKAGDSVKAVKMIVEK